MVPLSLSIRGLSLTALLIGIGCDSGARRDSLSSHTLHENSDASSGQSHSHDSAPKESPIASSEPSITVELPTREQPVTAAMFCENGHAPSILSNCQRDGESNLTWTHSNQKLLGARFSAVCDGNG